MKPLVLVCLLSAVSALAANNELVIEDVTVISPERAAPLRHASVVIRDLRIAEVATHVVAGPDATRIDGRGRFLIPGLIDSHVHPGSMGPLDDDVIDAHPELLQAYRAQLPRSYLAFGFTTLIDLDLRPATLAWFNAATDHPSLFHCGRAVRTAGGYGAQKPSKDANLDDDPKRAVDRVVEAGGICVKTFVEPGFGGAAHWPVPSAQTLAALRAETRRRGLTFVIHANAVEAWQAAIAAHADVIAHGLWHWPGESMNAACAVIGEAARAGIRVQPTLQAVYGDESIFDPSLLRDPRLAEALPRSVIAYLESDAGRKARDAMADEYRQAIAKLYSPAADPAKTMSIAPARASATLRMMNRSGVKLIFGTDTPSNEGIGSPPGLNGRFELRRWFDAGVPLARILRAATIDNAIAFGLRDRGTIEPGKRADLLLLHANPLKTIDAYDAIDTIILGGKPIERASLLPDSR